MRVIVKKWTKREKRDIAQEVTSLYINLKKKYKDLATVLFIIDNLQKAIHTDVAVDKIKSYGKDGWDLSKQEDRLQRARRIVEGMESSDVNLLLFKDEDEVWFQYHLGLYLQKPTFIIAPKEDRMAMLRIKIGGLVRQIVYINKLNEKCLVEALEKMKDMMEKEKGR